MQRLFVFLILTFSVVGATTADAREPLPILRQLCIADHGTGFNWKDEAWMQVNYTQPKFVALKVDYPEIYPKDGPGDEIQKYFYCTIAFGEETDVNLETFKSYNACLRVSRSWCRALNLFRL